MQEFNEFTFTIFSFLTYFNIFPHSFFTLPTSHFLFLAFKCSSMTSKIDFFVRLQKLLSIWGNYSHDLCQFVQKWLTKFFVLLIIKIFSYDVSERASEGKILLCSMIFRSCLKENWGEKIFLHFFRHISACCVIFVTSWFPRALSHI